VTPFLSRSVKDFATVGYPQINFLKYSVKSRKLWTALILHGTGKYLTATTFTSDGQMELC